MEHQLTAKNVRRSVKLSQTHQYSTDFCPGTIAKKNIKNCFMHELRLKVCLKAGKSLTMTAPSAIYSSTEGTIAVVEDCAWKSQTTGDNGVVVTDLITAVYIPLVQTV